MSRVLERVIEQASYGSCGLRDAEGYDQDYFLNLALLHEQMHDKAIKYTRQSLSYPPPIISIAARQTPDVAVPNRLRSSKQNPALPQTDTALTGDAEIPGGSFPLGSASEQVFAFDNELLATRLRLALLRSPGPP